MTSTKSTLKRPLLRLRFVMVLQRKLQQGAGLDPIEAAYSAAGGDDRNQLPLIVSSSFVGDALTESNLNLWDREETVTRGRRRRSQ